VVLRVDGRLQPVCARYGPDALLAAESLVVGGVRALHELFDIVDHDVVEPDEWRDVASPDAFLDVDTPADAERLGIVLPGLA
jgi:molybdopterin-guanine dinucleotide biosynthesis protein A